MASHLDHLRRDAELGSKVGLIDEHLEGDVVVGGVGGDGGDDAGSLAHADGEEGEGVDALVLGVGGGEGEAHEVHAGKLDEALGLGELLVVALAGEALGGPVGDDEDLSVEHLEGSVLALGEGEAVGLAVHGLGAEGGGGEEYVLAGKRGERARELEDLELDDGVLLGPDALSLAPVVVCTDLLVKDAPDIVPATSATSRLENSARSKVSGYVTRDRLTSCRTSPCPSLSASQTAT